jgi:hypothetical protein
MWGKRGKRGTVEIAVALGPAWRSAKTSEHQSVANFNI